MTPNLDPDFSGPSGPNWGFLLLLAISALMVLLAGFGAYCLGRILRALWS